MENFSGKKRPSINLSLFTTLSDSLSSSNSLKSPRNFENGVVGLGIVAAMTGADNNTHESFRSLKSPRSNPVPIVSSAKPAANFRCGLNFERDGDDSDKTDKLSETYACVISHCGSNQIKRRVYFDDNLNYGVENCRVVLHAASSPINIGEMRKDFRCADFLNSCFLCEKELHGLDIFMYRYDFYYVFLWLGNYCSWFIFVDCSWLMTYVSHVLFYSTHDCLIVAFFSCLLS